MHPTTLQKTRHYAGRAIDVVVANLVPSAYRVGLQYQKQTLLLGWEPEIRLLRHYARKSKVAIDVGANIGLWSYAMAKSGLFEQVIAFEPNARLTLDLENTRLKNVTIIHKAVSSACGTSRLRIPRQHNVLLEGWASLEDKIDVDAEDFQELLVQTIRLDDLGLEDVGFIKIDVEGHELRLLEGARHVFSSWRPACLIECRMRNKGQVREFLFGLGVGYEPVDTQARFGFCLSTGNTLFSAS